MEVREVGEGGEEGGEEVKDICWEGWAILSEAETMRLGG